MPPCGPGAGLNPPQEYRCHSHPYDRTHGAIESIVKGITSAVREALTQQGDPLKNAIVADIAHSRDRVHRPVEGSPARAPTPAPDVPTPSSDRHHRRTGGTDSASCSSTPKSFDNRAFTDWKLASDSVSNNTSSNLTTTITVTTSRSTTTGLKLTTSVKGSVLGIVEVAVTAEASQTWTNTYTFSQAITVTAKPGEKVSVESRVPVKRVTGDFTLVTRNTTWNLYDVNCDSPDADRRSEYNAVTTPIPTGM